MRNRLAWKKTRRVTLVIVPPEEGELFPRTFFLITSFGATRMTGERLLDLYRQRGTYEQQLGQFMSTLTPQLSSTTRPKRHYRGRVPRRRSVARDAFATNQALLSLNVLAYNLLNLGALIATRSHTRHRRAQDALGKALAAGREEPHRDSPAGHGGAYG